MTVLTQSVLVILSVFGSVACAQERGPEDDDAIVEEAPVHTDCLKGTTTRTKVVTHYMIPLLEEYNHKICNQIEGTCIYKKKGIEYLHNYGYDDVKLEQAHCKNGWGNQKNCLHPCRVLAASMKHHKFGEILYIPELVGHKCGNMQRDGFEMIHDGYVVVMDTGSPRYFNAKGRFDFFWGRCKNQKRGECFEGAIAISKAITKSPFCKVWDPDKPKVNLDIKNDFVDQVKAEAIHRGDKEAAGDFNL